MAYKFKRQIFGFMDLLRFKKMVPKRAKMLEEGSVKPLPKTYRVNETAKILHPGVQEAEDISADEMEVVVLQLLGNLGDERSMEVVLLHRRN